MRWLLFDTNYLAWRAFWTTGGLSHGGTATGVLFGVMRDIVTQMTEWNADGVVFCFDDGTNKRKAIYPEYKADREKDPELAAKFEDVRVQIHRLKHSYLPAIGFINNFYQNGYEADDVIAVVSQYIRDEFPKDEGIIISGDEDFYQLLSKQIMVYNPTKKECMTRAKFKEKYDISPIAWSLVLSMAGGHDNIKGIPGIGKKTAVRYLQGNVSKASKTYRKIKNGADITSKNLALTHLPFPGVEEFEPQPDRWNDIRQGWDETCSKYGMKSLVGKLRGIGNNLGTKPVPIREFK